jgi:hypothetical protein
MLFVRSRTKSTARINNTSVGVIGAAMVLDVAVNIRATHYSTSGAAATDFAGELRVGRKLDCHLPLSRIKWCC